MTEQQTVKLNINSYIEWKEKGNVELQKVGKNSVFLVKEKYDEHTGELVNPVFLAITEQDCNNAIENCNKAIEQFNKQKSAWEEIKTDIIKILKE